MVTLPAYLAIDLGAESGRAMLGRFDGERVTLDELHRFPNEPVRLPSGLHWDAPRLYREIVRALEMAATHGIPLAGVAVDTWGVDFGLLDRTGALVGLPFHYRDPRVTGMIDRGLQRIDPVTFYAETGCQTIAHNTAFQLLAFEDSPLIEVAESMLMMPDLMSYWLSGEVASEATIASTSQLYNPVISDWAYPVIERLGLPRRLFSRIEQPGTIRGQLRAPLASETGIDAATPVVTIASHDTASAFAAVNSGPNSLVVSSGTWSLVGVEMNAPIVTEAARAANFTNEAGIAGTTRFLRNVAGMWLVQECRRTWAQDGQDFDYGALVELAGAARPFLAVIDPNDAHFYSPGQMPERIRDYCQATGQACPTSPGEFVRTALEGLALTYRRLVERIQLVTGRPIETIHIVGGGSRNRLHCQLAADATGLPVLAGPVETTALGNVMTQALALGAVGSLAELREVIARSFIPERFIPAPDRSRWDAAYARFIEISAPR